MALGYLLETSNDRLVSCLPCLLAFFRVHEIVLKRPNPVRKLKVTSG